MHTSSPRVLNFNGLTLNLMRCALLRGEEEIQLRPKAFDVLRYLVEHPGRLVSKDELIQAVWPGIFVTDDSLVQCIGEIREALDDEARRIIKTVPRRGYVFVPEVSIGRANLSTTVGESASVRPPEPRAWPLEWRRRSMAVAGILILLVGAGVWSFWERARAPIVVAPAPAESSTAPPALPERRIALVIGNSSYAAGTLANTQRDAEALAGAFRRAGFAEVTLRLDLAREEILEVFQAFAKEAEGADWAVFYFAGRGIEIGGINYLVPIDARLDSERDASLEAVTLDQVLHALGGARKLRLAILDACRGDPFGSEMMRLASGIRPTEVSLGKCRPVRCNARRLRNEARPNCRGGHWK